MIEGKKILITGGAGFIGSHLCDALAERNSLIVLDDLSTGKLENISQHIKNKKFKFIRGDICNAKAAALAAKGCELIFHEAAIVGVRQYVKDPLKVLLVNTKGTENVLEAARKNDAKVIFASTSEVYGKSTALPLREDGDRLLGSTKISRWCYSTSKAFDEHLCFAYAKIYSLPVTILRYFNTYGPRGGDSEYAGVVPVFISRILSGEPPLVHGDGLQTRCFTYISDIIEGTLLFAGKQGNNEVINLGSDRETTILELANLIISLSGKSLQPKLIPYEAYYGKSYEDIRRRIPDISKARSLGWEPKVSLCEGLEKTINWYKEKARK